MQLLTVTVTKFHSRWVDVNPKEMDGIMLKPMNAFLNVSVLLNKVR